METENAPHISWFWAWICLAGCLLISVLLITPILASGTPFLSDDYAIIATNLEGGKLSPSRMADHFTVLPFGVSSRYYRPVYWLSYAVDFLVAGTEPLVYYISGALLHGMAAWFLMLIMLLLGASRAWAVLTMAFFLCHPVHLEPLTWIAARSSTLSAAFALGALAFFVSYRRMPRFSTLAGFSLFFALGLLTREIVVIVPGIVFALDFFVRPGSKRKLQLLSPYIASIVLVAAYMAARHSVLGNMAPDYGDLWTSLFDKQRINDALFSLGRYFVPVVGHLGLYQQLLIALPSVALLVIGLSRMRLPAMRGILAAAFCLFALASLPSLPILLVTEDLSNSRLLYLPSAALCIVLAAGALPGPRASGRRVLTGVAALLVLCCAGLLVHNQKGVVEAGRVCKAFLSSVRSTGLPAVVVPRMQFVLYADHDGDRLYKDETARFIPSTGTDKTQDLAVLINVPREVNGVYVFFTSLETALSSLYGEPGVQVLYTEMSPQMHPEGSFFGCLVHDDAELLKWNGSELIPVSAEGGQGSALGEDIRKAQAGFLGSPELQKGDTFHHKAFHPVMTLPVPEEGPGAYRYRMLTPLGSHLCSAVPRLEGDRLVFDPSNEAAAGALFRIVENLEPGAIIEGQALFDFDHLYCILFIEKMNREKVIDRSRRVLLKIDF